MSRTENNLPRFNYTARTTMCPRGHEKRGRNAIDNGLSQIKCRACDTSFAWAKRNNLFNDDPRVLEHMAELYARYLEES